MRLVLLAGAALCAAGSAAVIATATGDPGEDDRYEVAALFDTANGVVAGSRVKIAGAAVGSVARVELAPGPKARLVLRVPGRFAPFRTDARCSILPEGLLAEKYVSCDPGTATAPQIGRSRGGRPTVPLARTTIPLSLQAFLNALAAPTPDRMRLMFNELGIATAGRGEDINALLRRSNPALDQARRVLGVVDRQRGQLAHGIAQMDRVMGALAAGRQDLRRFVDRAAVVSETSAAHAKGLAESIRRLPPMLRELRPALRELDRSAAAGRPALAGLGAAGPAFADVTRRLPPFLAAGRRAVPPLAAAARVGRRAMRETTPLITQLRTSAADTVPSVKALNPFLISIRDGGGIEGFLRAWYSLAVLGGGYDEVSHIYGAVVKVFPQCLVNPPGPGCNARYDAPGQGTIPPDDPSCGPVSLAPWAPLTSCRSKPAGALQRQRAKRRRRDAPRKRQQAGRGGAEPGPALGAPERPSRPDVVRDLPKEVQRTLEGVLGGLGIDLPQGGTPPQSPKDNVTGLLDYLLGP